MSRLTIGQFSHFQLVNFVVIDILYINTNFVNIMLFSHSYTGNFRYQRCPIVSSVDLKNKTIPLQPDGRSRDYLIYNISLNVVLTNSYLYLFHYFAVSKSAICCLYCTSSSAKASLIATASLDLATSFRAIWALKKA